MILSDRDLTNTWSGAADGTLEARLYHLQNWRNDLCAVADGDVIARHYRYSAYDTRTEVDGADYNRDGFTDFFDTLDFNADHGASAARADFNNNGLVNSADSTDFVDSFNVTSDYNPHSAPRGLYAGYEHDPALEYQGALSGGGANIYTIESYAHVRHRVYSTELGRWTRRDPIGYHDGMGLHEYCSTRAVIKYDPSGLLHHAIGAGFAGCAVGGVAGGAIEAIRCNVIGETDCARKAACAAAGACATSACMASLASLGMLNWKSGCICGVAGAVAQELCTAAFEQSNYEWKCGLANTFVNGVIGCLAGGFGEAFDEKPLLQSVYGLNMSLLSGLCPGMKQAFDVTGSKRGVRPSTSPTSNPVTIYPSYNDGSIVGMCSLR